MNLSARALKPVLHAGLLLVLTLGGTACRSTSPAADATPATTTRPAAAMRPAPVAERWDQRGDWQVRFAPDEANATAATADSEPSPTPPAPTGTWTLTWTWGHDAKRWLVLEARSDRPRDWAAWITAGFPEATGQLLYEIDPASLEVRHILDVPSSEIQQMAGGLRAPIATTTLPLVAAGHLAYPPIEVPPVMRDPEEGAWMGTYGNAVELDEAETLGLPIKGGYRVYSVYAGSFADHAGLQPGDIIVRISPFQYDDPGLKVVAEFRGDFAKRYRIGDTLSVEWIRNSNVGYRLMEGSAEICPFPIAKIAPDAARADYAAAWSTRAAPEQALITRLTDVDPEQAARREDLYRRLRDLNKQVDAYRLAPVMALHGQPWAMEPLSRDLVDTLPPPGPGRLAAQIAWSKRVFLLDVPEPEVELPVWKGGDLNAHLDYIEAVLTAAAAANERALAAFSEGERVFLLGQGLGLLEAFVDSHMMVFDTDLARQRGNMELLKIASRLDRVALFQQALLADRLVAPDFLASLRALMQAAAKPGLITSRKTDYGLIALYGDGDYRHLSKTTNPAFLADLGGDDYYANNTGSNVPGAVPTAVLVDFAGNDRYENWRSGVQGCGTLGVGYLVDYAGDDVYDAKRLGQGAGFFGVGMLADLAGNDTYRGVDYCQGAGQFGLGLLYDDAGDNTFFAHTASQGIGLTWGLGLLHCAGTGRDTYTLKGLHASGYGDAGSWEGWGQGLGTGHRSYASGGVGLLVDAGGDDHYDAGTFAQGGGYYYGLGILNDRAGNDEYRGSRYNKGFTAHQAIGVFLDDAGNDRQWQSHHVASGMSWDESCTLFVDRAGDDIYCAPGFAYGAAAMNGFTLFIDRDGSDSYKGPALGASNGNSYHGGSSLGIALDLGGGTDTFSGNREANTSVVEKDTAVFVDAPTLDTAK